MILLFILLVLEALLTAYRVKTGSLQRRLTVFLRGMSLFTLSVLCALSIMEWGFRYYALAAALAALLAASIVPLLRKKACKEARGRARLFLRAGSSAALLLIVSLPAIVFPEYAPLPATGPYQVKTDVRYFTDDSRMETFDLQGGPRTLAAAFWYPQNAAEHFPLIVYSHGAFGTRTGNETLFGELASNGYVVCAIDHTYHCLYTTRESGETIWIDGGFMRELRSENAKADKAASLALYKKWMATRVADIHFVLDTILNQAKAIPYNRVYGLIDTQKTGVMGHSLGGSAALGIGRLRSGIGAVIALEAPFLCDILDVQNDLFVSESAAYPVPVLNVYSDSAWTHLSAWPQYVENVKWLSGAGEDTYNVHIAGTGHLSLTDLSLFSPILTRLLNGHPSSLSAIDGLTRLNQTCLSFFDCFLKGTGTSDFE